jgi:hypothetical protein
VVFNRKELPIAPALAIFELIKIERADVLDGMSAELAVAGARFPRVKPNT